MSDNSHRFGPAGPNEDTIFGACRPGYPDRNPSSEAIDLWLDYLLENDVSRICCLLTDDELEMYAVDLAAQYRAAFDEVCRVPVEDYSRIEDDQLGREVLPFLRAADIAEDRTVVHCSAGLGRTGHVLALWLRYGRLYDLEDAIEAVRAVGRRPLESPELDTDSLADLNRLVDASGSDLSDIEGRHLLRELERRLLTENPVMRIERTKHWAPVIHPDRQHTLAQIHPQQTQLRMLYRHDPDDHPSLSEGPAGGGFGDTYSSMLVVQSPGDIPTAVELITHSYTGE
jgi:protein-tyrosine phosphatase